MSTRHDPAQTLLLTTTEPPRSTTEIIVVPTAKGKRRKKHSGGVEPRIRTHHRCAIRQSIDAGLDRILGGGLLAQAKVDHHRGYLKWFEKAFQGEWGLSVRTAQRYIDEYERFVDFLMQNGMPHDAEALRELFASHKEFRQRYSEFAITRLPASATGSLTGSNDWLTSTEVLRAAIETLGEIECDPCASSSPDAQRIAPIEYSAEENGLDASNPWPGAAWVAPGHRGSFLGWCRKVLTELASGNLHSAILCLPFSEGSLPLELLRFPFAVSRAPLTVDYLTEMARIPSALPKRSAFVYVAADPDVDRFATAFSEIAVAFAPLSRGLYIPGSSAPVTARLTRSDN